MDLKRLACYLGIALSTTTFAAQYEAEDATLAGGAAKSTDGTYVSQNEGSIMWKVSVAKEGKYTMTIHYKAGSEKTNYVEVNGSRAAEVYFPASTKFTDINTNIFLKAGDNDVAITRFWGWIDVDYITIEEAQEVAFTICKSPTTEGATESAVKLYNFLVNNFQSKTISGVMTGNMDNSNGNVKEHEDVQAVYTASGKYPALVGFDFLNATGKNATESWYKEYTNKALALAEDLWNQGGIPAFTWHWNDPTDSVMAFYTSQNAAGKDNDFTTFDFTKAFIPNTTTWDTLSSTYKDIVSDIDEIAAIFLKLQEKGVAAIFRPLHESGGNWFWWSTNSGKQFAALYRLVYERMVFMNKVKNLVWVFNPSTTSLTEWNPGETYYDVLSVDIYNKAFDNSSNSGAFDNLKNNFGVTKVLSLSENGPIPDVEKMQTEQAVWSWWMPWYESWDGGFVSQTKAEVWKSNLENENIITLEDMPGWANYAEASKGTESCPVSTTTSKYGAGSGEVAKNYVMGVNLNKLGEDGVLINTTKIPDLSSSKSISVDLKVPGSGAVDGGVWIGLAFVKDGSKDSAWTWEMSQSTGCWLNEGSKKTCTFDITSYADDDGVEHPMDIGNLFSMVFIINANGYSGLVTFDNIVTDDEKVIASFDSQKELFNVSEGSEDFVKSIELVDPEGSTAIKVSNVPGNAVKSSVYKNTVMLSIARTSDVSVSVFGLNGKRIMDLHKGTLEAGVHSYNIEGLSKGSYLVRVKGNGFAGSMPLYIK
ncbi:MAG: beta-mannosidase [Fibrobacteraceae bacterium]|nr:beta-mannosidase [Fibrobacteraceae bacterium]